MQEYRWDFQSAVQSCEGVEIAESFAEVIVARGRLLGMRDTLASIMANHITKYLYPQKSHARYL